MCSVAAWILFTGLLSTLLYQVISRRKIEVHRLRAATAPDLLSFDNDLQFDITTISDMTCSNFRVPSSLVVGSPGSVDFRIFSLSEFITIACQNTTHGPLVSLKCEKCQVPPRDHYISWQFVDLPGVPAGAVGFFFNLTARSQNVKRYMSFVNGTIKSTGFQGNKLQTFRGSISNVLKIQLFPQTFLNLDGLELIQPLIQDFLPGSSYSDVPALRSSLQNPADGVLNTTLYVNYLSDYIVEVDKETVLGPVSIIASIGGLYTISVVIFLCLMQKFEFRVKNLRNEDTVMLGILNRQRAKKNWDKVRKFVMYTWGPKELIPSKESQKLYGASLIESLREKTLPRKKASGRARSHQETKKTVEKADAFKRSETGNASEPDFDDHEIIDIEGP